MANEVLGNRYDTWFGVCGRLEDLVGKVAFGDEDDESAKINAISRSCRRPLVLDRD